MNGTPVERIRVLLFTNSIAVGGMEEHVELLAKHLDRGRFEVFAVCPDWEPIHSFAEGLAAASDHFALFTPDRRRSNSEMVRDAARLVQQINRWKIDVAHLHSTTYRGQVGAFLATRAGGARAVYVTEHLAPERLLSLRERIKRDAFTRLVDGVVCVSQKNYLARAAHLYTPSDKTLVVNNGVDLDDFPSIDAEAQAALRARYDIPLSAPVVGTVVRFERDKGLEYLFDALPAIHQAHPEVRVLMVGDGSLRPELEAHAARLGLANAVHFTGFQKDPRPFLACMNAFVLPVPVGSMSIGLLEAMAMERAVVITFGGEGEAVIDGHSGYCAEPRNPEAIAESVIRILGDRALERRLGQAARSRVEHEFSAQRVARSLGDLYAHGMERIKAGPRSRRMRATT